MHASFFQGIRPGTLLFGRFEMVRCIDASDQRAIYLCKQIDRNNRAIALKVVSSQYGKTELSNERMSNEIEVSRRVAHPNVLKCFGVVTDGTFDAYSFEFMPGGALSDLLTSNKQLDITSAFRITLDLAAALTALHRAGITHRDIKPENVLLDEHGQAKMSDFGISVVHDGVLGGSDDIIIGTLNYLSPEYILHGSYDQRSDIYSLGLVAYEVVAGQLPEQAAHSLDRLVMRAQTDAPDVRAFRPDCPAALAETIAQTIVRDPSKRFQSAAAFETALLDALSQVANCTELYKSALLSANRAREFLSEDSADGKFDA